MKNVHGGRGGGELGLKVNQHSALKTVICFVQFPGGGGYCFLRGEAMVALYIKDH